MARYALILNNVLQEFREYATQPVDIPHKGVRWLPCPPVAPPAVDPTAEKLVGPTYTINATDVTEVWSKVALTAQEISDAKDAAVAGMNGAAFPVIFRAIFNLNNRVRVLEGQPPLTVLQFKAALKALL